MEKPKQKGVRCCCVINCKNTTKNSPPGTEFYRFPVSKYKTDRRQKWIIAVKKQNPDGSLWQPKDYSRICSQHFVGNRKSEHPLSPSYNPTIFSEMIRKRTVAVDHAIQRFKRHSNKSAEQETQVANSEIEQGQNGIHPEVEENKCVNNDNVDLQLSEKNEASTQVNFLVTDEQDYVVFVCIKHNNLSTTDAEVQCSIPLKKGEPQVIPTEKETREGGCATDIHLLKAEVSSENNELDEKGFVKFSKGFHEASSVEFLNS